MSVHIERCVYGACAKTAESGEKQYGACAESCKANMGKHRGAASAGKEPETRP